MQFKLNLRIFMAVTLLLVSSSAQLVSAMCPLCVAGAAAGLGIARYYGLDDTIVGIWLGALAISSALWVNRTVRKRFGASILPYQGFVVGIATIAATILPFYFAGFFNGMPNMADTILGINRVLFGIVMGSIIAYFGAPVSNYIKRTRGKAIPYQSVLFTIFLLFLASIISWYVTAHYHLI